FVVRAATTPGSVESVTCRGKSAAWEVTEAEGGTATGVFHRSKFRPVGWLGCPNATGRRCVDVSGTARGSNHRAEHDARESASGFAPQRGAVGRNVGERARCDHLD